jgi:hypothetical protein
LSFSATFAATAHRPYIALPSTRALKPSVAFLAPVTEFAFGANRAYESFRPTRADRAFLTLRPTQLLNVTAQEVKTLGKPLAKTFAKVAVESFFQNAEGKGEADVHKGVLIYTARNVPANTA